MAQSERNSNRPHIVVVGAGIVGSSIAFHLALREAQVSLLDADEPGQGASAVSFAWINGRDKNPRHYHDLNRRSLDMWDRFARRLGGDIGLIWGGEMRWAATAEGANELTTRVRELQSWGYPIRLIGASEMVRMEPGLSAGTVTAASYTEIDGHVDTGRVIRACIRGASERGAEVRSHTKVTDLHLARPASAPPRVEAVGIEGGEIPCDAVVLSGGADTPELASHAGIELPLHFTFGATILTEPIPPVFQKVAVVHTPRDLKLRTNFRQLLDGSLMIHGGSGGVSQDGSMGKTDEEAEQVFEAAAGFVPSLKGTKIKEVRRGRRPIPEDGHPVLGFAASVPNLYFAAMHSGVSLAALVGAFAAVEIIDGARIDILEPYRVERFG